MSSAPFVFQHGQASGLAVVVAFAALSLVAVDFVWLRVLWVAINQLRNRGSAQGVNRERHIFHSQLGAYMASLLFSNLLSSVSFVLNVAWISIGRINPNVLCISQATVSQVADVATAYFTGAIAVHTFNSLVLHRRLPYWFCGLAVAFGWVASIIMALVPAEFETKAGPFYAIDGALCGISSKYFIWQTSIHFVPIFVAAIVSVVFYSLVFLIIRGSIAFKGGLKFNFDLESRRSTMYGNFESPKFIASVARSMLWYPAAYISLMFPHLVICLMGSAGLKVSFNARVFTAACSALLGFANVLIFYNTIRVMGPAFDGPSPQEKTGSSFGGDREKSGSPVDVAPPVAAFVRPAKSFPPPRTLSTVSSITSSSDSTHALLATRYKHTYSSSMASVSSAASVGRSITPASDLHQMIATPPPAASKDKSLFHLNIASAEESASLPAPRRSVRRKPVNHMHEPTLPTVAASPVDGMTAIPLRTPKVTSFSQRDSFINMYASRSPIPTPEAPATAARPRFVPPTLTVNDGEPVYVPGSTGSNSGYSTESDAPSSAFADKQQLPAARPQSFRARMRERSSSVDVHESGLSPLAWASLVTDAATSNGAVQPPAPSSRAAKRRSRSMDGLAVPATLRPRVPASATLRREFSAEFRQSQAQPQPASAGLPARHQNRLARMDSRASVRQAPLRTPTYKTSSDF